MYLMSNKEKRSQAGYVLVTPQKKKKTTFAFFHISIFDTYVNLLENRRIDK
jgi:hypothetical protein